MAVDVSGGKMYWTGGIGGVSDIKRANLDGTGLETLVTTSNMLAHVAIDAQGGKMYWADSVNTGYGGINGRILRANLDGSIPESILTTGLLQPVGIALDVQHGTMYFTDLEGPSNGTGGIWRANLNGSGAAKIINGIDEANGLAIDVAGGKLYWTELVTKKIQCANLDGTGIKDLVTGLDIPTDIALDLSEGKMYWTEWSQYPYSNCRIRSANLDGSGMTTVVSDGGMPWGIAVAEVPEPSTFVLLAMGAIGLIGFAWRRRKPTA
jgi:low density lipoprotein receptor-related protein 5/6